MGPPFLRLGFGEFGGWPDNAAANNYHLSFFCRRVKEKYLLPGSNSIFG
jgi:hypothetical protein